MIQCNHLSIQAVQENTPDTMANNDTVLSIASYWSWYCPEISNLEQLIATGNATKTQVQTSLTLCISSIFTQIYSFYDRFDTYQSLIFGILGLLGTTFSFYTLATTRSVYFKAATYRYFRLLAIIQGLTMLAFLHGAVRRLCKNADQGWYGWFFITVYMEWAFSNIMGDWADLIVCYLSLERATACLLPSQFSRLQRKPVFFTVITVTLAITCTCMVPQLCFMKIVYRPQTGLYGMVQSIGPVYDAFAFVMIGFFAFKCAILFLCTSAAIIGFLVYHKKKHQVRTSSNPSEVQRQQQVQLERKVTTQLCMLQIAQAVPAVITNLTLTIGAFTIFKVPPIDTTDYAKASNQLIQAYANFARNYFAVLGLFSASRAVGHCVHSYLYLACSRPFRKAAKAALGSAIPKFITKRWPILQPQQPTQTGAGIP